MRALLLGLEQPHVLDRDHRLVGEGGDEIDLLLREGIDRGPRQEHRSDRQPLAHERNAKHRSEAAASLGFELVELGIGQHVRNMDDPTLQRGPAGHGAAVEAEGMRQHVLLESGRHAMRRNDLEPVAVQPQDGRPLRAAEPRGRLDQRVEHPLQIEGRAADDLEHVGGRGLLLQRLPQLLESRVFSMAMTAWLAKFVTNSICFSVNGRTSWR